MAMSNSSRDLHDDAHREWRDECVEEFAAIQRRAFKAGFEAAATESKQFRHLRQWLEEQRDEAEARYGEADEATALARRMAFVNVLVKLSEMGCEPENAGDPDA